MVLKKWLNFFSLYLPFINPAVRAGAPAQARLPYRVITLCRIEDATLVEQLIQRQLFGPCIVHIHRSGASGAGSLTQIEVNILCSVAERADVVQLVTRLALEKSVRSVRWESVPQRCR